MLSLCIHSEERELARLLKRELLCHPNLNTTRVQESDGLWSCLVPDPHANSIWEQ